MDDLSSAVDYLYTSSTLLNNATDELSRLVQQVEEFLNERCSVGLASWVRVREEDLPGQPNEIVELGYARYRDRFRILVLEGTDADCWPPDHHCKPWAEVTRDLKLETASALPELFIKIASEVDAKVRKTIELKEKLAPLLENLNRGEGA